MEVLLQNGYLEYQEVYSDYDISNDTVCYFCGHTYSFHENSNNLKNIPEHSFHPATFLLVTGGTDEGTFTLHEDKQRILKNTFNNINR